MSRSDPFHAPVPVDLPPAGSGRRGRAAAGPVEAQLLGQEGARHGLRAGAPALRRARAAYLTAEWSGEDDRRPEAGLLVRRGL